MDQNSSQNRSTREQSTWNPVESPVMSQDTSGLHSSMASYTLAQGNHVILECIRVDLEGGWTGSKYIQEIIYKFSKGNTIS